MKINTIHLNNKISLYIFMELPQSFHSRGLKEFTNLDVNCGYTSRLQYMHGCPVVEAPSNRLCLLVPPSLLTN